MKVMKKLMNKGFTLVELIVTIAIMTIVGGAITSFIVVSQRQYNNGAAETDLQYEAQLVTNQLSDLMIDATKGISYMFVGSLADGTAVDGFVLEDVSGAEAETKEFYVYNKDYYYKVEWNKSDKKLLFSEFSVSDPDDKKENQLLAEFVSAFSVDMSEVEKKRTVKFTITFTKEATGREYTTSHVVKLRNDVLLNKTTAEMVVPEVIDDIVASNIDVMPEELPIWQGESGQISAIVVGKNNTPIPGGQWIDGWEMTETNHANTSKEADLTQCVETVFVGTGETGSVIDGVPYCIELVAKRGSLKSDADESPDSVMVQIRSITDIDTDVYQDQNVVDKETISNSDEDKYKITVKEGQTGYSLKVIGYNGSHLPALDSWLSESGKGVVISDFSGDYFENVKVDEAAGTLLFDIRNDIAFGEADSVTAEVTISCRQSLYSYIKDTYTIVIEKKKVNDDGWGEVIDESKGWPRNGYLELDLTQVPSQYLSVPGAQFNIRVLFESQYTDGYSYATGEPYNFGSQGGVASGAKDSLDKDYNVQKQNGAIEFLWRSEDTDNNGTVDTLTGLKIRLCYDKIAFNKSFYDTYPNGIVSDFDNGVTGAKITLYKSQDMKEEDKVGEYHVPIAPIDFEYHMAGLDTMQDSNLVNGLTNEADSFIAEDKTIYATPSDNGSDKTYRVYYKLADRDGWVPPENALGDGAAYYVNTDRFACLIGNMAGYTKWFYTVYYKDGVKSIVSGEDSNGYCYLDITLDNDFVKEFKDTQTLSLVYEGNRHAGLLNEGDYGYTYSQRNKGCENIINFKFVSDNINEGYKKNKDFKKSYLSPLPSTQYCPEPDKLDAEKGYHYISETERFRVRKLNGNRIYITYEKLDTKNMKWNKQWKDDGTVWLTYDDGSWEYSNTKISD